MADDEMPESYRPLLFAIAYQMTGSASEAEDLVQETYLRYQQALPRGEVRSLKAYLTTITTRLALDYRKSARHTREQYVGTWLPEPLLTADPSPLPDELAERREAVSMAFLVLLESLTPPERAVLLLHQIFDLPFDEVAAIVGKSPAACRQIYHRAQAHLADRQRRFAPADEAQQQLVLHFFAASQQGDLDALVAALERDATVWGDGGGKALVAAYPLVGAERVARFFIGMSRRPPQGVRIALAELNGMPATLLWEGDALTTAFLFAIEGGRIAAIYSQRNPDKLAYLARQLASRP